MNQPYPGSCLCGSVRFEIDAFASRVAHCHCSMCRKFHGAAFATLASVSQSSFHWICGENLLQHWTAANHTTRSFCSLCGSSLFFRSALAPGVIEVALGVMDVAVPVHPDAHIFVESAVSWFEAGDGLVRYARGREA